MSETPKKSKAFVVTNEDDHSSIQFAEHNVVARRIGAAELNSNFESVRCTRAAEFDKYTELGQVPKQTLFEDHGWWFDCHCNQRRFADDENTPELEEGVSHPRAFEFVWFENQLFCHTQCLEQHQQRQRQLQAQRETLITRFNLKFPDCTVEYIGDFEEGFVKFRFPNGNHIAYWTNNDTQVTIDRSDLAAWTTYRAEHPETA